jgi:hypothetical protein
MLRGTPVPLRRRSRTKQRSAAAATPRSSSHVVISLGQRARAPSYA